ncbi:MAG: tRNA uridine-5-carboxymethylaminomethyl(34) synthesis enzyme MnmG [Acutalibacteraceae bacterium]|nr:tRNA uridine-5-carboxymethylaminomethyl(34) synthesis enzyme MnmG [Acutalibacteraceae bacterium]
MEIKKYNAGEYEVAVIGGGHAGVEAALSAARLGCKTIMFTISVDWVGNMPCNPSIGGTAKGHLVRELDALGGEMGKAADKNTLQSRMLNLGKGPAVHSLRAQIDRRAYSEYMKHAVELQENLDVKQCEITEVYRENEIWHCVSKLGADFSCRSVVIATGTFLGGRVYVGEVNYASGPDGNFPATELAESLKKLGLPLRRFKTGTPARVSRDSIDFSALEVQEGDSRVVPFSYSTETPPENKVVCHISYTNDETKRVILENINRSPLYAGDIEGVGPRYCPSIEDKIVRFADKKRHQFFIEPCGINTEEMYLQGLSSSLPEEVQIELYKTVPCLKDVKIIRNAYAIEYDCVDPTAMRATLEMKDFPYLYGAGQFNGSSGYEEAAVQGFIAGVNAALKVQSREPLVLSRASSYIGTLVDDLVTKGCSDPYRMMTSRSEYRLLLRQDNADERLMPIGRELGLIDDKTYSAFLLRKEQKEKEIKRLKNSFLGPNEELNRLLEESGTAPISTGTRLSDLVKRPQMSYDLLAPFDKERPDLPYSVREKVETEIKYEGYITRQQAQVNEMLRLEGKVIPYDIDYTAVYGLRLEAVEKLNKIRPANIGQASRISGVSPADISVLLIYLAK